MAEFRSNITEAISNWNLNNPELPKKTIRSLADEIGLSASSISQIDKNHSWNQFQKHCAVIFESKLKSEQLKTLDMYKKLNIPIVNRLIKICSILQCEIWDVVKKC